MLLVKLQSLSSTKVNVYVPPVNPEMIIFCGLFGTLLDQVNVNGGLPCVMKVFITPLFNPSLQDIGYK